MQVDIVVTTVESQPPRNARSIRQNPKSLTIRCKRVLSLPAQRHPPAPSLTQNPCPSTSCVGESPSHSTFRHRSRRYPPNCGDWSIGCARRCIAADWRLPPSFSSSRASRCSTSPGKCARFSRRFWRDWDLSPAPSNWANSSTDPARSKPFAVASKNPPAPSVRLCQTNPPIDTIHEMRPAQLDPPVCSTDFRDKTPFPKTSRRPTTRPDRKIRPGLPGPHRTRF